jgi:ERCC4-type nuclease
MAKLTLSPFTVLVDTREQLPYTFASIRADANQGGATITVPTRRCTLNAGDYSIDGYARMVTVERKSLSDLAGSLTRGRRRFNAELERLREYDAAWIVCEAELSEMFTGVQFAPNFKPRTIVRSAMFWQIRYPRIHWWAVPGRDVAEAVTYQLLRSWWRERIEGPAKEARKKRTRQGEDVADVARMARQMDLAALDKLTRE